MNHSQPIQLIDALPPILDMNTICILDTEGMHYHAREIGFLLCTNYEDQFKCTSYVLQGYDTIQQKLLKVMKNLMLKPNLVFVGFNTVYDLQMLQSMTNLSHYTFRYIDVADNFRKFKKSNCVSLNTASDIYRNHHSLPKWERSLPHSSIEDCVETLHCLCFIATKNELIVKNYTEQPSHSTQNLMKCIQKLADYAFYDELNKDETTIHDIPQKKRLLRSMLLYVYECIQNKKMIASFSELVYHADHYTTITNLREYGIGLQLLLNPKNSPIIFNSVEWGLMTYLCKSILDWKNNTTSNKQYQYFFDTAEKKNILRTDFEKQEKMLMQRAKEWVDSYTILLNKQISCIE